MPETLRCVLGGDGMGLAKWVYDFSDVNFALRLRGHSGLFNRNPSKLQPNSAVQIASPSILEAA
jgi:hypothetical protein